VPVATRTLGFSCGPNDETGHEVPVSGSMVGGTRIELVTPAAYAKQLK